MDLKRHLIDIIDFYKYKNESDRCTMEEIESLTKTLEENLDISGTIEDFAKFYNQPRTNISSVIHRSLLNKPRRRVSYSFMAFSKIVPKSWKNHK